MQVTETEKPPHRIGYLANRAARLFTRIIDRRLKGSDVVGGVLPVMLALNRFGAVAQKKLAQLAEVEQPTMAQTLSRMERDDLVTRAPDPADGRSSLFSLTAKSRAKVPAVWDTVLGVNEEALAGFSEDEKKQLAALLHRVIANLETML